MRLAAKWRDSGFSQAPRADFGQWAELPGTSKVRVLRAGGGRPIVVLGGLAGGIGLLGPLISALAERNTIYAIDLDAEPRLRRSPLTLASEAQRVAEAIRWLGLERPSLLGVSYGGAIALELAVERPGLLGGLLLSGVEAAFRPSLGTRVVRRVLESYELPGDSPFINQFFNLLHGKRPGPGPLADFVVERCWETDQATMLRRLRALESFDVSDRLWRLDVPTRIVAGSRDVVVPASRQRLLAQQIGGARYAVVEGAGHIGFVTHPAEFARQSRAFVAQRARSYC